MAFKMSAEDYKAGLSKLELTQEGAGKLVGVGPRTARRWASGEAAIPGPMSALMRLWLARPELVEVVRGLSGLNSPTAKRKKKS